MAIMISIQPQWVDKILKGEKTLEIRKTMPKCELPQKVYIYCTKGKDLFGSRMPKAWEWEKIDINEPVKTHKLNERVVAEFTLKEIETIEKCQIYNGIIMQKCACLTPHELTKYTKGKKFHAWHIENLNIYDEPKDLSKFKLATKSNKCPYSQCSDFACGHYKTCDFRTITRPPQMWCYVEDLGE